MMYGLILSVEVFVTGTLYKFKRNNEQRVTQICNDMIGAAAVRRAEHHHL